MARTIAGGLAANPTRTRLIIDLADLTVQVPTIVRVGHQSQDRQGAQHRGARARRLSPAQTRVAVHHAAQRRGSRLAGRGPCSIVGNAGWWSGSSATVRLNAEISKLKSSPARVHFGGRTAIASTSKKAPGRAGCGTGHVKAAYRDAVDNILFLKRQQWLATNYVLLLYVAIFVISAHYFSRTDVARNWLGVITIAAFVVHWMLHLFQRSIETFRNRLVWVYRSYFTEDERAGLDLRLNQGHIGMTPRFTLAS